MIHNVREHHTETLEGESRQARANSRPVILRRSVEPLLAILDSGDTNRYHARRTAAREAECRS